MMHHQNEQVDSIIEHYGQIDALVTAAGIASSGAVHTTDVKDWQMINDVNLSKSPQTPSGLQSQPLLFPPSPLPHPGCL